jgi:hypothetical protein
MVVAQNSLPFKLTEKLIGQHGGTIEGDSSSNSRSRSIWLWREFGAPEFSLAKIMLSLSAISVDIAPL